MNSDTNLYPLQKSFGRFYCRWRKEAQKTGIANSQYLKRTQKHIIIYSISIFFFLSGLWGFGCFFFIPHFSLCSFRTSLVYFLHNRVRYTYFIFYLPWFWYFLFNRKTTMAMTTTKTTTAMQSPIIMIKVSLLVEVFVAGK